jgi:hypothetical protein
MNVRRPLRLITEMLAVLSGIFFFDYSGVPLAWRLLSSTLESKPRKSCAGRPRTRSLGKNIF